MRTTRFARVPPKNWCLHDRVHYRRRQRLLHGSGFVDIVNTIAKDARILTYKRRKIRDIPGYYRAEVTLQIPARVVDLFHNSAAGYRAQYYRSAATGEIANKYAIQQLATRVMQILKGEYKRTCPPSWMERSLLHPKAKVWIHQGRWLLIARLSDRNLSVKRWLYSKPSKKKRRLWATLTPMNETRIDLKGAPLTRNGRLLRKNLKHKRSEEIHAVGYT
jgi:hypothetical protein